MDEQTRRAAMIVFQSALMLGGGAAVSFFHADQGAVNTWTDMAMHEAPKFAGAAWLVANHYGWKVSDLFRRDTSRVDALDQRVADVSKELAAFKQSCEAWQREVEASKGGGM